MPRSFVTSRKNAAAPQHRLAPPSYDDRIRHNRGVPVHLRTSVHHSATVSTQISMGQRRPLWETPSLRMVNRALGADIPIEVNGLGALERREAKACFTELVWPRRVQVLDNRPEQQRFTRVTARIVRGIPVIRRILSFLNRCSRRSARSLIVDGTLTISVVLAFSLFNGK